VNYWVNEKDRGKEASKKNQNERMGKRRLWAPLQPHKDQRPHFVLRPNSQRSYQEGLKVSRLGVTGGQEVRVFKGGVVNKNFLEFILGGSFKRPRAGKDSV